MRPASRSRTGFFHGGAVGAIADSGGRLCRLLADAGGSEILTVEYKLNLIRPAVPPTLRAEGRVLRAGKTLTVCRADVFHCAPSGAGGLRAAAIDADADGAGS